LELGIDVYNGISEEIKEYIGHNPKVKSLVDRANLLVLWLLALFSGRHGGRINSYSALGRNGACRRLGAAT